MSLREWLIAIGALVILGIVIDGVRRMRRTRREAAAISDGMGADDIADPDNVRGHNPELPNGGSRLIDREELESRGYFKTAKSGPRFANPPQKPTRPIVADSRKSKTEADIHDGYEPASTGSSQDIDNGHEHDYDQSHYADPESGESGFSARDLHGNDATDESLTAYDDKPLTASSDKREVTDKRESAAEGASGESEGGLNKSSSDGDSPSTEESAAGGATTTEADPTRPKAGANRPDAQEVIVINVLAAEDRPFDGNSLRQLFEGCGLEFGDMAIYHRHEGNDTRTPVQFSVANALEPGTFRDQDLKDKTTPGISFFMSLPGPSDFKQPFEFMLETAQCVVRNLGGELKDERRSVMTRQTIEHCRQRIREYERKHCSKR